MFRTTFLAVSQASLMVALFVGCASRSPEKDRAGATKQLTRFHDAWENHDAEGVGASFARATPDEKELSDAFAALKSGNPSQRATSIGNLESFAADPRYNDKVIVGVLAALGARDAAIRAAANLVQTRGLFDAEVLFEPNMAAARSEPGYANLVRKLGLLGYWRSAPSPPDICRGAARPSYCAVA